jgi:hypothetical protein
MTVKAPSRQAFDLAKEGAPGHGLGVPDSPYRGLVPYDEDDAPFFFGRTTEQELVEANLIATRLTVLYAGSGVGKTSVLRAGVARRVRDKARANVARRGIPKLVPVVFSSWRDDPVAGLHGAVRDAVDSVLDGAVRPAVAPSSSLADTLDASAERARGDLLVILDQFEEYFLYHADDVDERGFAHQFARAVNRRALRANFLIAIREDSLAKLDRFKGEIPSLFENYLRLDHLDREAARLAIEMPLAKFNSLRGTDATPVEIEPRLVEDVLDQVQTGRLSFDEAGRGLVDAPETNAIEAPFLQLVMTRLWNEEKRAAEDGAGRHLLRAETLVRLGGADRIAKTHLDTVMGSELTPKERTQAARVFHYLVTPSGAKIAHRASDLAEYAGLPQPEVESLLKKLSAPEVRVLRPIAPPPGQDGAPRYEIFHDVLGPAVLDWRARQTRRPPIRFRVWLLAAVMSLVALSIPIGSLVVAPSMRRVRPPHRWKHILAVVFAWWIGWLVGVFVGLGAGALLWPDQTEGEEEATGGLIILFGAVLGPLVAFAVFSLLRSRSREPG